MPSWQIWGLSSGLEFCVWQPKHNINRFHLTGLVIFGSRTEGKKRVRHSYPVRKKTNKTNLCVNKDSLKDTRTHTLYSPEPRDAVSTSLKPIPARSYSKMCHKMMHSCSENHFSLYTGSKANRLTTFMSLKSYRKTLYFIFFPQDAGMPRGC